MDITIKRKKPLVERITFDLGYLLDEGTSATGGVLIECHGDGEYLFQVGRSFEIITEVQLVRLGRALLDTVGEHED